MSFGDGLERGFSGRSRSDAALRQAASAPGGPRGAPSLSEVEADADGDLRAVAAPGRVDGEPDRSAGHAEVARAHLLEGVRIAAAPGERPRYSAEDAGVDLARHEHHHP